MPHQGLKAYLTNFEISLINLTTVDKDRRNLKLPLVGAVLSTGSCHIHSFWAGPLFNIGGLVKIESCTAKFKNNFVLHGKTSQFAGPLQLNQAIKTRK